LLVTRCMDVYLGPRMTDPSTLPIHHSLQLNSTTGKRETSLCDRRSMSRFCLRSVAKRTLLRIRLSLWPLLLIQLARETRNFYHCISTTIQTRGSDRGVSLGRPSHTYDGQTYPPCIETQARTEDTLRLGTERPWLTYLDYALFVEGWNAGARSPVCIHRPDIGLLCIDRPYKPIARASISPKP
jgi:hypothetical protein